jgi:hypothetical protein
MSLSSYRNPMVKHEPELHKHHRRSDDQGVVAIKKRRAGARTLDCRYTRDDAPVEAWLSFPRRIYLSRATQHKLYDFSLAALGQHSSWTDYSAANPAESADRHRGLAA